MARSGYSWLDVADAIDVAEYRGSTDPTATHIRYIQLKHPSLRTEEEWIAGDLTRTLENSGARYLKLVNAYGEEDVARRFSFEFVTNRPFAASLEQGFEQLRSGEVAARGRAAAKQLRDLADQVISGPSICVIRADAGVGKSVLSTQLGALLPAGSQSFVYDCFGNGAYRGASGYCRG